MLDQMDNLTAQKLAEHHHYPFAQNIYQNIFKAFSFFPLNLNDIDRSGPGKTISCIALSSLVCLENKENTIFKLFRNTLGYMEKQAASFYPQNISVETFLGCALYFYHPSQLKNMLTTLDVSLFFNSQQIYEYEIKKKTILIFAV